MQVRDTASLIKALGGSRPGDVIQLEAGEYAPEVRGFHGSLTLTSADPTRPATFTSLLVQGSSGLTVANVVFDTSRYPPASYGAAGTTPFRIMNSSEIALRKLEVHGSPNGSLETDK